MALLPQPRLRHLDDQTGLTVFQYDKMAPGRQFCDVVLAKARFELTPDGISRSARSAELCLADTHRNESDPLGSSLAQAGDLIVGKPGADIYVSGLARRARPARYWGVRVTLGPQAQPLAHYECAATGPRHWRHSLLSGWQLSETEPTQAVPIEYELSYGGSKPDSKKPADEWERFEPNPSGTGFSFEHFARDQTPAAPQWESASAFASMKSKELVGLGPVARFWTSRKQFIGTYDEAWQREQLKDGVIADYPADFDLRFFQCAHPKLQTAAPLKGDEALHLEGLLPTATPLSTRLPGLAVLAALGTEGAQGHQQVRVPLDTVHIDLEENELKLVWRLTLPHSLNIERVHLTLGSV